MEVKFSYLAEQFADLEPYLEEVAELVKSGRFTLGERVEEFERGFAAICGAPHAIGVASGTDALILSLRALGIGPGDEVITTPTTFIATVGAIVTAGARPVFIDSEAGFVIDPGLIEAAITPRTKAIVPVHYSGNMAAMPEINAIAERHGLRVIEDACQAIGGAIDGRTAGQWGDCAAFSLHPLKNLNVWGDGGVIVTGDPALDRSLRLLRNHGLSGRDEVVSFGCNSRLDALQAVVGNRLLREYETITNRRIENAARYDRALGGVEGVAVPPRRPGVRHVYHLYMVRAERRDDLRRHLQARGIDARIHYPVPLHLQPAAGWLGYRHGDFPVCEQDCASIITLPAHQHLEPEQIDYVVEAVQGFYRGE